MNRMGGFVFMAAVVLVVQADAGGARKTGVSRAVAQAAQTRLTIEAAMDREISNVEGEVVGAAEAMPEDKFNFTPAGLNLPGSDYKGVRSFAVQVRHIAASNYFLWSAMTGDKLPEGLKDGNGPENLKSKAEIIQFLKDSFALGHRAATTLTAENILQMPEHSKWTRFHAMTFGVAHAFNHYGQMVEYLRMNGIVPPASRLKAD